MHSVNRALSILAVTVWIGWLGYVLWRDKQQSTESLKQRLTPFRNAFRDRWIDEEMMRTAYAGTD